MERNGPLPITKSKTPPPPAPPTNPVVAIASSIGDGAFHGTGTFMELEPILQAQCLFVFPILNGKVSGFLFALIFFFLKGFSSNWLQSISVLQSCTAIELIFQYIPRLSLFSLVFPHIIRGHLVIDLDVPSFTEFFIWLKVYFTRKNKTTENNHQNNNNKLCKNPIKTR